MSKNRKKLFSIFMTLILLITTVCFQTDTTYAAKSKVTITSASYPTSLIKGQKFTVKGKIVAKKKIKRVEIGIVKASTNKWTKYKYDNKKVKKKSFNVSKAAGKLKFNKLPAGKYYYRIYAHTSDGVTIVLNKKFTVKTAPANKSTTSSPMISKSVSSMVVTDSDTMALASGTNIAKDRVTLSSFNYPVKYNVGTQFPIRGVISCNNVIKRVEIGIIVTATNKWSEYKYDNAAVNAYSFDISNAADTLKFDKLPGGTFTYRIYIHTDNGVTTVLNNSFIVNPSSKPAAAIKWATAIAGNDHYTYGRGYGGYFTCCVCANKTTKKSDAQFTCMPFLAAAYAHGTGDAKLLNNGRHIMNLNDDNFKGNLGEAWFKIGLCKDLTINDLQPGDVIIKWSDNNDSGHSWMYGGGDSIIEAVPAGIRVLSQGAATKLRSYGTSEGKTSKNYVMRYRH